MPFYINFEKYIIYYHFFQRVVKRMTHLYNYTVKLARFFILIIKICRKNDFFALSKSDAELSASLCCNLAIEITF